MTDKDIKDYCKNCDVEPPAMKFKCPECKHNPDKKQIIIDGVDVSKCKHHRKCILPDNIGCKIDDFLCRDKSNCYFKQSARKTHELEVICKAFDIEYAYDDDGKIYGRSNKLRSLEQECEELKKIKLKLELNENHNKNEIKKLKKRIRKDREFFKNKISSLTLARKEFLEAVDHFNWQIGLVKNDRYRKALEKIEKIVNEPCIADAQEDCKHCDFWCEHKDILGIINKAKGEGK